MLKRVLHVVTYMGRGGLETMIMNYYRKIDRKRIQFDFLVHRQERSDYDDEIESLGGKIYRLPRLNPWSKDYLRELEEFFIQHKEYQIVHSHVDCMSAIPLKAAKKAGVPVRIAHSHNSNQDKDFKYLLKLYYKRKISSYATHLFACSEEAGKWMFETDNFNVLPNAIEAKKYAYSEEKRKVARDNLQIRNEFVIGHVGRFSAVKNHKFLIEILGKIHNKIPNVKLVLVGSGEKVLEIKEEVKKRQLEESVIFTGVRSDVENILQAVDVFVLPSLYEGLPVTMIEAQAAGLPCFISDRVPIECKKTDLVLQISLNESAERWAEEIIKKVGKERKDTYQDIVVAGFDINRNVEKLQAFYVDEYDNNERE